MISMLAPCRANALSEVTAIPTQNSPAANVDSDPGELELFLEAKISLRRAIKIAEKLHSGSRTAEITFDSSSGSPVYRVRTTRKAQIWENAVDAKTGDITGSETVSSLESLDTDERNNFVALKRVRQELSDAVLIAEKAADGKAISGRLADEDGKLNFVIFVVSGDHLKEVLLEPAKVRRP